MVIRGDFLDLQMERRRTGVYHSKTKVSVCASLGQSLLKTGSSYGKRHSTVVDQSLGVISLIISDPHPKIIVGQMSFHFFL